MPMRVSICILTFLVPFLISATIFAAHIDSSSASVFLQNPVGNANDHHDHDQLKHSSTSALWSENKMEKPLEEGKSEKVGNRRGRTLQIAGSRLPDCLHACGSCSPCRLVSVGLACASHTDEAESCPISYRCMCNSKSYPVP